MHFYVNLDLILHLNTHSARKYQKAQNSNPNQAILIHWTCIFTKNNFPPNFKQIGQNT